MTYQDFMPHWRDEEKCFEDAIVYDVRTGKPFTWPRIKPVQQIVYDNFINKVTDPKKKEYYPERKSDGTVIKGTGCKHKINTKIRIKRSGNNGGKEFLYWKGKLYAYDSLANPLNLPCSKPEVWNKTNFGFEKVWDEKTKSLVERTIGPSGTETVYAMPFNEKNLKELFDKRENDDILQFVVKDESNGRAIEVKKESNINNTFKLFLKPFDYLFNADYITPQQKAENRRRAEDEGIIPRNTNAVEYRQEHAAAQIEAQNMGMYL